MNMTIIDFIEMWWISVASLLDAHGVAGKFERSPVDRLNPSCSLNLHRGDLEVDILVWASGEAELAMAAPDGSIQQKHFNDVRKDAVLGEVLSYAAGLALNL
jgi:hypothetical protein